ncbi:MAG: OmpH family outer membrane protein [Thermoanaerobaculia bacterium]|nr:OmpH family outer membrane protein [Thermoanaerobaculia bacterium]
MNHKNLVRALLALVVAGGIAVGSATAQEVPTGSPKIAVIESERIVAESAEGRAALESLRQLRDQKMQEGQQLQQEIVTLRQRLDEAGNALSQEKQAELRQELEDKTIALRRFQDDADRELAKERDETLAKIEKEVLEVIHEIGREGGYTIIMNKYQSGLVYADDAIDITDRVIERFNARQEAQAASGTE